MGSIDAMLTGHYHHPSWHMVNDKLGVINGSIAGTSGYEWWRGYNPVIGTTVLHLGGGLPPKLEILTEEALLNYKPRGYYSDENLARKGFNTDRGFDSREHGFGRLRVRDTDAEGVPQQKKLPQSALQKALWDKVEDILRGVTANLKE